MKKPDITLHSEHVIRYKFDVVRNGKVIKEGAWRDYMITDAGYDLIGSFSGTFLNFLNNCIIGTGAAVPVRRDSSPTTFTQSGTTLTASAAFFSAADVGRLFKWGTGSAGNEVYITGFTSSTVVTVGTSATVSTPSIGTVWYVNTAALVTPVAGLTWSKDSTFTHTSTCTTSGNVATLTHTTVNISSALVSAATITEIAIHNSTTNSGVFDRDVVSPNVGMAIGDQAKVTIVAINTYSPILPQAVANFATGYNSAGNVQIETLKSNLGLGTFTSVGGINGTCYMEPSSGSIFLGTTSTAVSLAAFSFTSTPSSTALGTSTGAIQTYGTGTHVRDTIFTFGVASSNGSIAAYFISDAGTSRIYTLALTTPFTKSGTQTLTVTFRKSWTRILTN